MATDLHVFGLHTHLWARETVGGKGASLLTLAKAGFRVPPFVIIGAQCMRAAIHDGFRERLAQLDREVSEHGRADPATLSALRESALHAAVPTAAMERVGAFMDAHPGASFAVRSSGISEDTATAAFAGQYATLLHRRTRDSVEAAVRACWASQFADAVWAYADSLALHEHVGMGVVIQVQIDSVAAGVAFSRNAVNGADPESIAIEGAYGQGEAVVSGAVTPDAWTVRREDGTICARRTGKQHMQLRLGDEGLVEAPLDRTTGPCLTDAQVHEVAKLARELEALRGKACDLEWAVDGAGHLWLLQARDITTHAAAPTWTAPGEGTWIYDPVHFPACVATIAHAPLTGGLTEGFAESANSSGTLLGGIVYRVVNGVFFEQMVKRPAADVPAIIARGMAHFERRGWRDSWVHWNTVIVPRAQARHFELKAINMASLSDADLAKHFLTLMDHWRSSMRLHHVCTMDVMLSTGYFLKRGAELTGADHATLLQVFQGSSHYTRGVWNPATATVLRKAFEQDAPAHELLLRGHGAAGLEALATHSGPAGVAVRGWLHQFDHYISAGYDGSTPTYSELPDMVLHNFRDVVNGPSDDAVRDQTHAKVAAARESLLARCADDAARAEFDSLLKETLERADWRDMRGLCHDVQACGLVRLALREIGRRLPKKTIPHWEWLIDCAADEVVALLLKHDTMVPVADLRMRRAHRMRPGAIPPFLGQPPHPPPDVAGLPPVMQEAELSIRAAILKILPMPREESHDDANTVTGTPANPGCVTGIARVLHDPSQWGRVKKGDIAVIQSTSSSFNILLPLLGAIVTDYGGTLTHAAICAREFGIPAVTACWDATTRIRDGATITVDGAAGKVFIVK